jgi:hypothetical protein
MYFNRNIINEIKIEILMAMNMFISVFRIPLKYPDF